MANNLGSAHILVDLSDGVLSVRHGSCGTLLFQRKARQGTWENIWRILRGA